MINALLEPIWPYLMFAGAAVGIFLSIRTHQRGWIKDEDDVIQYRKDHPRSFLFNEMLGVLAIAILIYVGVMSLYGWG